MNEKIYIHELATKTKFSHSPQQIQLKALVTLCTPVVYEKQRGN